MKVTFGIGRLATLKQKQDMKPLGLLLFTRLYIAFNWWMLAILIDSVFKCIIHSTKFNTSQ